MTYYLIDFENVHAAGISNPALCEPGDIVCIYFGTASQDLPLETIHAFFQRQIRLETVPVNTGSKNALDFQLATHLGYLIGSREHADAGYRIVSNDTGYDCVIAYWKEKGVDIERIADLTGQEKSAPSRQKQKPKKKTAAKDSASSKSKEASAKEGTSSKQKETSAKEGTSSKTKEATTRKNTKEIISTSKEEMLRYLEPDEYVDELLVIFNGYKTRTSINNYLAKYFRDSQKASAIYKKLKPLMTEKGKS
jgi:hypothetical protein